MSHSNEEFDRLARAVVRGEEPVIVLEPFGLKIEQGELGLETNYPPDIPTYVPSVEDVCVGIVYYASQPKHVVLRWGFFMESIPDLGLLESHEHGDRLERALRDMAFANPLDMSTVELAKRLAE